MTEPTISKEEIQALRTIGGLPTYPDPYQEGVKFDEGKLRWDLLPWDAVEDIVCILTYGAQKYDDRNWEKGMDHGRLFAACQRHLKSYWQDRENIDPESNLHHLAHAACNLIMLLALHRREQGKDDRP